jgi:chromosome segregation ATPase
MGRATQQTIAEVKQRLAVLDKARDEIDSERERITQLLELLLEQFGTTSPRRNRTRKRTKKKRHSPAYGTAKQEIHSWLTKNQGSSRAQVIEGTKFPGGTVGAYLSTEKSLFERREDGWHAL